MRTISFDFDFTLWDEDERIFIPETVSLLNDYLFVNNKIIIVTSRLDKWIPECHELLAKINLKLDIFSAPGHPHWDTLRTKSHVLIEQNAVIHYDDCIEWEGLTEAKQVGIQILLPPATKAYKAKMYQ